jgi:hypothetical protein
MISIVELVKQLILWTTLKMEATDFLFIRIHKALILLRYQEHHNSNNSRLMICLITIWQCLRLSR